MSLSATAGLWPMHSQFGPHYATPAMPAVFATTRVFSPLTSIVMWNHNYVPANALLYKAWMNFLYKGAVEKFLLSNF